MRANYRVIITTNYVSFSYPPIRPLKLEILRAGELGAERTSEDLDFSNFVGGGRTSEAIFVL